MTTGRRRRRVACRVHYFWLETLHIIDEREKVFVSAGDLIFQIVPILPIKSLAMDIRPRTLERQDESWQLVGSNEAVRSPPRPLPASRSVRARFRSPNHALISASLGASHIISCCLTSCADRTAISSISSACPSRSMVASSTCTDVQRDDVQRDRCRVWLAQPGQEESSCPLFMALTLRNPAANRFGQMTERNLEGRLSSLITM